MKLKLVFKSAKKKIEKDIELDSFTLMSLLNEKAIVEIFDHIDDESYENYGCYLSAIIDED